jgi:cytochrome c oxidase assembly factor CtaG
MAARHRRALWAGVGLVLTGWLPPLSDGGMRSLAIHTLTHMLLIVLAAPLLAYGLAGVLDRRHGRVARVLGHPLLGLCAFNGILLFWQLPESVRLMMQSPAVHQLAHLLLLASAVCLWYPVLRPLRGPGAISRIGRVGYLLLAGVPPTIPGMVLVLARRPLYAAYAGAGGLSALEDQQLAGLLLFGTAKLALVAGTLAAIWQLLTPDGEPPEDRGDRHRTPIEPPVAPAWLRRLDEPLPAEPPAPARVRTAARPGARGTPSGMVAPGSAPAQPGPGLAEPTPGSPGG